MYGWLLARNQTREGRLGVALGATTLSMAGYWLVNGLVPPRHDLALPVDHAIPFLPWTFAVYVSIYALPLGVGWRASAEDFSRMILGTVPLMGLSWLSFLLLPAEYPRPAAATAGAWAGAYAWLHGLDGPGNTFPSLHVGVTALAALRTRAWPDGRWWSAWAVAIILSTLTTKQHFVVDVVGGVLLAAACDAWAWRQRSAPVEATARG